MRSPQRVATLWLLRKIAEEKRKPLVWMDTETTGFNPKKQEIISISMLDEQGKPLLKHPKTGKPLHEVRITPQNMEEASEQALEINKYSEEAWKNSVPFADVADQIAEIVKTHRLAGHNVAFDRKFLEADLGKAGHDVKADPEMVDTMALSFLAGIPSTKLGVTADVLGIPLGDAAHGAYPDTEASRKIWEQLRDPKVVEQTRTRMQQEHGGPARGVMFSAMETSGDHPWKDDITKLAIVDHHGRTVFDAEIGEGEGKVKPADAVKEISSIYQDNMFGGDNPGKEADFVRSFIRKHSPKRENGKPELGFYSPVLDTATLRHVYGAGRRPSESGSLVDQAKSEAETFHEVADKAFGASQPHRNPRSDFDSWAAGRTFRHPLSKGDPRRKKDFITFTTLKTMAEKGLGGEGDQEVKGKAQKRIEALQRSFQQWQDRAQKYQGGN